MRVLLFSDIHGNLEALQACLALAPPHDVLANLGDIVGYGACPNEVIALVRERESLVVRGNHDKACAGLTDLHYFNPVAGMAVLWTQRALTPENLAWLRDLPQGPLQSEALPGVLFAHGSPMDEDEYLILPNDAVVPLVDTGVPTIFFGHTHLQGGFCLDVGEPRALRPVYRQPGRSESFELPLQTDVRYLINPGSVGQPRDADPRAAFALFDSEARTVTYFRAPYDIARAQQRIRDASLPERLALRLAEGR